MQQITNGQLLVTDLELVSHVVAPVPLVVSLSLQQYGITFTTEDMRQINSPRGDESVTI